MKTEIKVLRFLLENKESFTIRELSKKIDIDYKITHTAVNRLIDKGLVGSKTVGISNVISFNNKFSKEVFEAEFERRGKILENKNIKVMVDSIKESLKTVNFIFLLFGSYAKKTQAKGSDIDLMFVVPDEEIEKRIDHSISILPLNIHHLVFSEKQFKDMKNKNEFSVVHEAMKNNVILYGIEQFYELIR